MVDEFDDDDLEFDSLDDEEIAEIEPKLKKQTARRRIEDLLDDKIMKDILQDDLWDI
jgi:hypothetical protein